MYAVLPMIKFLEAPTFISWASYLVPKELDIISLIANTLILIKHECE